MRYKNFDIVKSNKIDGWFMTKCETIFGESISDVMYDIDSGELENLIDTPVTIYYMGEFGMGLNKIEGKLKNFGTRKYAQYNSAPYVSFVAKRKRKTQSLQKSYKPYMVVIMGHGHPNPEDGMKLLSDDGTTTVSQYKHSSFSEEWDNEADQMLNTYFSDNSVDVICDYRHTQGFNSYNN